MRRLGSAVWPLVFVCTLYLQQGDAIFSEQDGVEDFSWDMIWASVGQITPEGYIIEIALPSKQLRFQPGAGTQTVLFLGYSDNGSGNQAMDLERQNRSFFVKLGYAWVL